VKKIFTYIALFLSPFWVQVTYGEYIIYADGDLAPLGSPDGFVTFSDYLIASRIVAGELDASDLELSHGDLYPVASPDGVITLQDLLLLQQLIVQGNNSFVQNLDLFSDGPATLSVDYGGNTASTPVVVDGYTGPGATVINNPDFIDPEDASNTVWSVSISGGIANAYLGTGYLSGDAVLDSGFDLSGDATGYKSP
jgi:hypothetical protein